MKCVLAITKLFPNISLSDTIEGSSTEVEVAQIHGAFQWFRDAACMSFYPVGWKIQSMNGFWFKREAGGYIDMSVPLDKIT